MGSGPPSTTWVHSNTAPRTDLDGGGHVGPEPTWPGRWPCQPVQVAGHVVFTSVAAPSATSSACILYPPPRPSDNLSGTRRERHPSTQLQSPSPYPLHASRTPRSSHSATSAPRAAHPPTAAQTPQVPASRRLDPAIPQDLPIAPYPPPLSGPRPPRALQRHVDPPPHPHAAGGPVREANGRTRRPGALGGGGGPAPPRSLPLPSLPASVGGKGRWRAGGKGGRWPLWRGPRRGRATREASAQGCRGGAVTYTWRPRSVTVAGSHGLSGRGMMTRIHEPGRRKRQVALVVRCADESCGRRRSAHRSRVGRDSDRPEVTPHRRDRTPTSRLRKAMR